MRSTPALDPPNVLAIVNREKGAKFGDLIHVLTGNAYEGGEVIPMFSKYSKGRIREEKLRVHLYLWFDEREPSRPRMFLSDFHAAHYSALCRYLDVDPARVKRLPA